MKPTVQSVRKELAILIQEKHKTCTTDKEKNKAVEAARQEINAKYGKGWRERLFLLMKEEAMIFLSLIKLKVWEMNGLIMHGVLMTFNHSRAITPAFCLIINF